MNLLTKSLYHNPKIIKWLKKEIAREKAQRTLPAFIEQAWKIIEPGTKYVDNWHIHLIGEYMQGVNIGQIKRLIINIPPRHMKSIETTICYPAWTWTKSPEKRFIKISYSDNLSRKHNILTRDIINSPWYQENWGNIFKLKDDVNRQNEFKNNYHGFMFSTSTGGSLTGEGGDVIIIDDPQNPLMANSEAEREASISFFKNTLQTRLNDPKNGVIILIMQRLHENDLTGHIISENLGYEHLCLPAISPQRTVITFPLSGKEIIRNEGNILNEARFDKNVLNNLKRSMGTVQFAGQFQQTPAPAEGIIFKREWLTQYYTTAPRTIDIQSWDMAFTKSQGSAKVAGIVMGKCKADIYIKDLVNDKMNFTESVAAVRTLSGKWKNARAKVVENKANGPAIVNMLKKEIPGMVEFNPKGSKEERAMSVTPYFESGNIHLPDPKKCPWVEDLIRDLLIFPKGTYKDTVDALVQGILYLIDKPQIKLADDNSLKKDSYWRA